MDIDIFETLRAKSPNKENKAESIKEHIKNALEKSIELCNFVTSMKKIDWKTFKEKEEREIFFKNLAKAIILHDFGKIDYKFQWQLFKEEEKENDANWVKIGSFFNTAKKIHFSRHEILSSIYCSFLLKNSKWDKIIMSAILLHHYNNYFTNMLLLPEVMRDFEEDIREYMRFVSERKAIFKNSYNKLLDSFLKEFSDVNFIKEAIKELKDTTNWNNAEKLLESYLDDDLSEFVDFYEPANNLSNETGELNEDTYRFLVFLGALRRSDYSSSGDVNIEYKDNFPDKILKFDELTGKFRDKFNVSVLWQEEILKDKNPDDVKHLILIAPTGSGKTEFSILWAAKNPRKFIYTLPLRVALNDLFIRFRGKEGYFNKEDVDILHSTAFVEHVKENDGKYLDIERKITSSKLLSYPLMLTTPDQIFLTSLNYYGSDKVISIYPMSNIIIDEIQTFNPEMAAIIIKTLKTIKFLGGNILVMTATYPPYFDKFLEKELGFEKLDISEYKDKIKIKNLEKKRHCINTIEKKLFEYNKENDNEKISNVEVNAEEINKLFDGKQNALIVVNNVKKAISLYKYLKNEWEDKKNDYEIFLLHSRLIEKYKSERIKKIKEKLEKKEKIIVVSTQIIEASVDFDFDFMVTELSTIDSQIQRWGRVYRKRDKNYNDKNSNIVIFVGERKENKLNIDKGTLSIYDKEVLEATRDILMKYQKQMLSYEEEKKMVEETFNKKIGNKILKDKYIEKIKETINFLDYFSASKKSEAQRIFRNLAGLNAVVPSVMKKDEKEWVKKLAEIIESSDDSWNKIEKETGKSRWELKAEIYKYSVAIPEYAMSKYRWYLSNEFKGFWVLKLNKDEEIENIREYGLDGCFQDLEDLELENLELELLELETDII